jgi:Cupin-like domain
MTSTRTTPRLELDDAALSEHYNRMPFGFEHNLHQLDLFSAESLRSVCHAYAAHPEDYAVSQSAPHPGAVFYSVPCSPLKPHEAYDRLEPGSGKILLKRLEKYDRRFRDLLHELLNQVKERMPQPNSLNELVRLESSIFVSSSWSTTPFHFDPEVNFFSQIEGEKIYHLYAPSALEEEEVEPLYVRAVVDIGQVDLGRRDQSSEHVFTLQPGTGVHQPQDAPHWVETTNARSVSYTFVYETREAHNRARVRSFNHYLRRLHIDPMQPGNSPVRDAMKAAAMAAAIPVRKQIGRTLRKRLRQ